MQASGPGGIEHGGSLAAARALFPGAPEPWLDLSTGINPTSYPLFDLPANTFLRLPEPADAQRLRVAAAVAYGAPSAAHVVATPGTQVLLPQVYGLLNPGRAIVLSPTYAEHARTAAIAGHAVEETGDVEALGEADLAIVVNPNNPDGRLIERDVLLGLAEALRARGGMLVVDEAFMDVGPAGASLAGDTEREGLVVLRSFGKFFGLAGVRLGFALAAPQIAARLDGRFGPWSVSGPALAYGIEALENMAWQGSMRERLAVSAARLDGLYASHGVAVEGGTSLFRHIVSPQAARLFETLGQRGILLRRFPDRPAVLRSGLPASEADWTRLDVALAVFSSGGAA